MTTAAKKEWLKSVALFSTLSDGELDALATSAASVTVQKHGRVFEEGAPGDCCYVLTAGEARVVLSGDGDSEMLLATIRPRMIVGELALLDGSTRSAALVASELCRFIRIPAPAFTQLLRNVARLNRVTTDDKNEVTRAGARAVGIPEELVADMLSLERRPGVPATDPSRLFPEYLAAVEQLARAVDGWRA